MNQYQSEILERKIKILNMILTTYRSMKHLPATPTSETLNTIMFIASWINELEKEKSML